MEIAIKNELLEALARWDLSGGEFRVLLVVMLRQGGAVMEEVFISHNILADETGMDEKYCQRLTRQLVDKGILIKTKKGLEQWLKFNEEKLKCS